MDISKIYIAIEERSSLTGLTSLPVLMGKDGELEAVWFNFYFENRGEEGTVSVESVFTTKDGETVTEEESSLEKVVVPMEQEKPLGEEQDYYEELQELADKYQTETSANDKWLESEVRNYLKKVVLTSFLSAYEMVMEDWKQNHKEAETHTEEKTDTLEN
ncbi:MAG: hypothetical protein PUC28_09750 [Blautia sp.]|nr:hypothetical protein [Blautia sp.]